MAISAIASTTDSRTIYNGEREREKINFWSFCAAAFLRFVKEHRFFFLLHWIEFSAPKTHRVTERMNEWTETFVHKKKKIKRFEFTFLPAIIRCCLLCVQFLLACLALHWRKKAKWKIVIEFSAFFSFIFLVPIWMCRLLQKHKSGCKSFYRYEAKKKQSKKRNETKGKKKNCESVPKL